MSAATEKLRDEIAEACSNDCRESVRQLMYPAATMRSDIAAALDRYAAAIRAEERERAKGLVDELANIANAPTSRWEEDVRDQFEEWAKSRARHALAAYEAER